MAVVKSSIQAYTTDVDTITGNGNGIINFAAATPNLGNRTALSGTFTVQTTAGSPQASATVVATLEADNEYVEFDTAEYTITAGGGTITITGTSNSALLTFSLGDGDLNVTLPSSYTAGGVETENGAEISGDPGASGSYAFAIVVTVEENTGVDERSKVINIVSGGGVTASATIRESAGVTTLVVDPTELIVPQNGGVVTATVTSNTTWTIVSA